MYSCAINKLKEYTGKEELPFEAINYKFLSDFNAHMLTEGIKVNTISVYFCTIRALFNRAIRESIVSQQSYLFSAYRIKGEKTASRRLTLQEIKKIIQLDLDAETPIWHWRNYFLLSFCFIGLNFADLLTLTTNHIINGRIVFKRKKTGRIYSIKIATYAEQILTLYQAGSKGNGYLLPALAQQNDPIRQKKAIQQAIKACNEYLERIAETCGIEKKVTTYYARYTWANIAREIGYSKDLISEALGHQYGNRVTDIYLSDYEAKVIDEMNQQVLHKCFKI